MSVHHGGRGPGHVSRWPKAAVGIPAWVSPGAKFDADYPNDRYFWNDRAYGDETAFNTAVGGVKSGITRTFGPYVDPAETNLITNGDFADGTTGWAASGTGALIANVSNELVLTSIGTAGSLAYTTVSNLASRAFRYRATARKGTSTASLSVTGGINTSLNAGKSVGTITTTSATTVEGIVGLHLSPYYLGMVNVAGNAGTHIADNFSLVEVWPFLGFTQNAFAVALTNWVAPAAAVADEVIWQADCDDERNRVRVVRQVSDDHIVVIYTTNNAAVASLDLGVVADGATFSVALSGATNGFSASLNGGLAVTDGSGVCPGLGIMRVARSFTGNTWTGTPGRVTVF